MAVREAASLDDLAAMHAVFAAVWQDGLPPVNMAKAIHHAGGYAAVADDGERIVGGSLGFLGRGVDGVVILHSHITGALPGHADRGIGFALKQHQRSWCLDHDIATVTWTFDPLVRRNAYFNLTKLGAEVTEYHPDFYGRMEDALNSGDETDRVLATWRLSGDRAIEAAAGRRAAPTEDGVIALDVGDDGRPVVIEGLDAPTLLFRVPADIVEVRRRDAAAGLAWRRAVRTTLGAALGDCYVGTAMTSDGCYVLRRGR